MTLSTVKDKNSFEKLITQLKKMARKIREECPLAFPVFNIITQILSKLCNEESDEDQQKPRLLKLLSNIEEVPMDNSKSNQFI
jgi:translation initiation factor 2B subunit (eIF-2B alpha/beta/delta family)